ncbi:MAG: cobyrinate a,c-diamide synthase [Nitrospinae bacterium]|nr:cobyrinate a,c-diamide synthase [Nitrospinota bacterium]
MTGACPAIVVAGAASGVGKTSVTLGLAAALARRGMRVRTFKVGPDFLDPGYLALASGRTSYNLDTWMCGADYAKGLYARKTADADIAVVEGVMGMYDGADAAHSLGSTADVAALLGAPVLLVVNARGAARSLAAVVKGFCEFERGALIAGVAANFCGGERHAGILRDALASVNLPPLMAAIPKGALPELTSRHLGLVSADARTLTAQTIQQLADAMEAHADIDALIVAAASTVMRKAETAPAPATPKARIGLAMDEAFHFYYHDSLEALERAGAELVRFSPVRDAALPEGLDGLYLGGGYPEEHAPAISQNAGMIRSIVEFAGVGRPVYAECGGLIYLSRGVEAVDGARYPFAGILPVWARMRNSYKSLGYAEAVFTRDTLLGKTGESVKGHMFHYSELVDDPLGCEGWSAAYTVRRKGVETPEGLSVKNVLATYLHAHLASHPRAAESFVNRCRAAAHV